MEWILHALKHSAILIPFLFVSYVLIEIIENSFSRKIKTNSFKGKWAPLVGAGFGIIPQCGFSVVATDLYSKRKITLGTLIAIFVATSDEAIPLLLSNVSDIKNVYSLLGIILIKFVLAVILGYSIDAISKRKQTIAVQDVPEHNHEHHEETAEHVHEHHEEHSDDTDSKEVHIGCCGHNIEETKESPAKQYLLHPLIHTLKVFLYILIVNIIFEGILHYVGEDKLEQILQTSYYFAPLLACLIGLIPNCASSIVLTELMMIGGLSFSACVAGLIVNAGIAYLVLFKQNKSMKENLSIIGIMTAIGIVSGYLILLLECLIF